MSFLYKNKHFFAFFLFCQLILNCYLFVFQLETVNNSIPVSTYSENDLLSPQSLFQKELRAIPGERFLEFLSNSGIHPEKLKDAMLEYINIDAEKLKKIHIIGVNHGSNTSYKTMINQAYPEILDVLNSRNDGSKVQVAVEAYSGLIAKHESYMTLLKDKLQNDKVTSIPVDDDFLGGLTNEALRGKKFLEKTFIEVEKLAENSNLSSTFESKRKEIYDNLQQLDLDKTSLFDWQAFAKKVTNSNDLLKLIKSCHDEATISYELLIVFRSIVMLNRAIRNNANFLICGARHAADISAVLGKDQTTFLLTSKDFTFLNPSDNNYNTLKSIMNIFSASQSMSKTKIGTWLAKKQKAPFSANSKITEVVNKTLAGKGIVDLTLAILTAA